MSESAANIGQLTGTVTSSEGKRSAGLCLWCSEPVERTGKRGPTPLYCSSAHKQRAFEARRLAELRALLNEARELLHAHQATLAPNSARGIRVEDFMQRSLNA